MSLINGVGVSDYTKIKQKHFREIIRTHLFCSERILQNNKEKWPKWAELIYYYFDINAGPGIVDGQPGSPLIFFQEAIKRNLTFKVILIEKNYDNWQSLNKNSSKYFGINKFSIEIRYGDHHNILPEYFINEKKRRFGLIYADPSGNIPPFSLLKEISHVACYSKLDILINLACATIKRRAGLEIIGQKGNQLKDFITSIDKVHWLIRRLYYKHQFTFLVGTNWIDFPSFKKIDLWPLDSPEGIFIFEQANYSKKWRTNESVNIAEFKKPA